MNYTELIDALKTVRNKSDIRPYLSEEQLKLLNSYLSEMSSDEDLADQLMTLVRFSNIPLRTHFFEEKLEKQRKEIEKNFWNDLSSKEINDLSSIVWSISKGSLSKYTLIKSDENKTNAVKRFSFLLAITAKIINIPMIEIYESVIEYKAEIFEFYEDKYNILVSFLPKHSRFFIERCFFLIGTLWFGGDSFKYLSEEYAKNLVIPDKIYKDVITNLLNDKIITKNEKNIIKLNSKGIKNVRLSLVFLLSYWSLLFGGTFESDHVLPHLIYANYMLFGRNYNMKAVKKGKDIDNKKRRSSYKLVPKVYEYTYIFWSNIFDMIYNNPFLLLKEKYDDVRLFIFRYSLSPLFEDIIAQDDSIRYRELVRLLEELNIIKIITKCEKELIFLSKDTLGWLFENKKDSK